MKELYKDIVLDHYRNPRNNGTLKEADIDITDNNPSCGDAVSVTVIINDGMLDTVRFSGEGCAISMASASLMAQKIEGMSIDEFYDLYESFKHLITNDNCDQADIDDELDNLVALEGVTKFPTRIDCAKLAWQTLKKGIDKQTA